MFKCAITGKFSKPGDKVHKLVTETRNKTYYGWVYSEELETWENVPVGYGFEIVKEVSATEEGVKIWLAQQKQE